MIRATAPAPRTPTPAARPAPAPALPDGLLTRFLGKRVAVRLLFGDEVDGVLSRVDKFELLVTLADGAVACVFKGAVATIREASPV